MPEDSRTPRAPLLCPLVEQLRQGLPTDREQALAAFWQAVEARTTPLIDPVEGRDDRVLVTFVWRADEPIENVALIENFSVTDPCGTVLEQVEDTNVWVRSFLMDADLRFTYLYSVNDPLVSVYSDVPTPGRWDRVQPDPLNPHTAAHPALAQMHMQRPQTDSDDEKQDSYVELPRAPRPATLAYRADIPHGSVTTAEWQSDLLGTTRTLQIYTPPGYTDADGLQPCNLLVLFDGAYAIDLLGATNTLDNLIADGAIPPTVAVLETSPDRCIEYPCNPTFAQAIAEELVPWARATYRIAAGPQHVAVSGVSYGGLASAWVCLTQPEVVGNALSQSGSFQWRTDSGHIARDRAETIGEAPLYGWLPNQLAQWLGPTPPVRLWLDAGRLEALNSGVEPSLLAATRHFRDVARAKGYDVHLHEFAGGHDYVNWARTLGDGLRHLFGAQVDAPRTTATNT